MKVYTIPLVAVPQRFSIRLAGKPYVISCHWNQEQPAWELDIYDGITQACLVACLPLVTGVDLLSQHRYLGIGGSLIVSSGDSSRLAPTLTSLGKDSGLYLVVA